MNNLTIDNSKESVDKFFDSKIDTILPSKEGLRELLLSGKQLKFYMGADVTAPKLHIGHTIPLIKMAQLQKMGHKIIFLIGDFTGKIGDPTDKSAARQKLTDEEVKVNTEAFLNQIKILFNFDDINNPIEIRKNSEWNSKINFSEIIELASNFTVQQMIERDMFQNRLKNNKPIYLHEFLYPLIQGYDSVALEVDGEFGGSDQTFNMLAGRTLLKSLKNKEKYIITMKLLLSSDGINKMSKSLGNCIFLNDSNIGKYGKVMSIPDNLILHYYELLTNKSIEELEDIKEAINNNPMTAKKELAYEVVKIFNSEEDALNAKMEFERTVQNKEIPSDIIEFKREELNDLLDNNKEILLKDLITKLGITNSNSESKRLIIEGGVEIDSEKILNPNQLINPEKITIIKGGKRNWRKLI